MAQNIELGKFEFDTSEIVKGAQEIKKSIEEIKAEQKDLQKNNQTTSKTYVENEASLKALNKEYQIHIKALADSAKQSQETAIRNEKLELVLDQEVKTIKEAREQNKLLNQLRNDSNLTTDAGRAELEKLNAQLDRNNAFIKDNADSYLQQKINIGNYEESITNALASNKTFGGTFQVLQGGLGGAVQGMIGFTKASLAFIATPVGAVIAVLAGVFLLIKNALDRSEESTNKLKQAFAPFQGILNAVLDALEPLGEFLIDGIVLALELAEKAVYEIQDALASLLDFLGFDEFAQNVRDFNDALQESAQQARELEQARQDLTKAEREARLIQLEFQKDAETLRQIRDDESRSIEERIQANKDLGAVLDQQLQEELRIAKLRLEVTNLQIEQEGKRADLLDAQADALIEIADIEERINGQRSEQLVNENSLRKEARDRAREITEAKVRELEEELALFEAQQGFREKSSEEELRIAQETADRELEILQTQLDNKLISQAQYNAESLLLENDLAQKRAEILSENAMKEIEELRRINDQKRLDELFLTDEIAQIRIEDNNRELERLQRFYEQQLELGLINQDTFDQAIREAREENRIENEEIDREREAIKKEEELELRAIEFEEELARLEEEGATRNELERLIAQENRDLAIQANQEDFDNQLISEELFLARRNQINDQYNQAEAQRDKILRDQKLANISSYLGRAGALIDKESVAGKAIALAQTGISTFRGIAKETEKGFPAAIPGIALVSATGIKSALDIVKTKVPSATGSGDAGGGSGGSGGLQLNTAGALSGSGVNLSNLGSDNRVIQDALENASGDRQAQQVGDAVREGAMAGTEAGANQGITNASENQEIIQSSGL